LPTERRTRNPSRSPRDRLGRWHQVRCGEARGAAPASCLPTAADPRLPRSAAHSARAPARAPSRDSNATADSTRSRSRSPSASRSCATASAGPHASGEGPSSSTNPGADLSTSCASRCRATLPLTPSTQDHEAVLASRGRVICFSSVFSLIEPESLPAESEALGRLLDARRGSSRAGLRCLR